MNRFHAHFSTAILALSCASFLGASESVRVANVNFERIAGHWVQMTVTLDVRGNPSDDARDPNFLDDVRVDASLSYENRARNPGDRQYDFYRASAHIITVQRGRRDVHFFLPGPIVERDRLRPDPFAWLVELQIKGESLPIQRGQFSDNLQSMEAVESLRSRANAEGSRNDGILMSLNQIPVHIYTGLRLRFNDLPVYFPEGNP